MTKPNILQIATEIAARHVEDFDSDLAPERRAVLIEHFTVSIFTMLETYWQCTGTLPDMVTVPAALSPSGKQEEYAIATRPPSRSATGAH